MAVFGCHPRYRYAAKPLKVSSPDGGRPAFEDPQENGARLLQLKEFLRWGPRDPTRAPPRHYTLHFKRKRPKTPPPPAQLPPAVPPYSSPKTDRAQGLRRGKRDLRLRLRKPAHFEVIVNLIRSLKSHPECGT